MATLNEIYQKTGREKLMKELGIKNVMSAPRLMKIVLNIGLGEALENKKVIDEVSKQLGQITGQKAKITKAKKDIAAFKLRRGDVVGVKVTLRGRRMFDFFEKLIRIALSRIRDFRGVSDSGFDGRGSFTIGLSEQIVFPEIDYSLIDKVRGMEITFVTTGKSKKETYTLLQIYGMPFRKN